MADTPENQATTGSESPIASQTPVAVLGTMAEFHQGPIPYDIRALVALVRDIRPDLLCLDITPERWHQGEFNGLPPEYREALLPLAQGSDIVVVPIGEESEPEAGTASGWREVLRGWLRKVLTALQRGAPSPDAINHGWRHDLANLLYHWLDELTGRQSSRRRDLRVAHLTRRILEATQRDPDARVLAVVNVRYCHRLRPRLRRDPRVRVVRYNDL